LRHALATSPRSLYLLHWQRRSETFGLQEHAQRYDVLLSWFVKTCENDKHSRWKSQEVADPLEGVEEKSKLAAMSMFAWMTQLEW
jgi:hypothetical protein